MVKLMILLCKIILFTWFNTLVTSAKNAANIRVFTPFDMKNRI